MANDTETLLLCRISSLEDELLALNRSSIDGFNHQWTNLVSDLQVAMNAEQLSTSTIQLALVLSNRVSHVVQTFYDLEVLAEKLMSSLLDETSAKDESPGMSRASEVFDSTLPPYIKPSYGWLLHNIHNPYPSTHVRDTIARNSGTNRKDVDNWFIDIRKRIGWNQARRTYFSNKRADIVDAATRFYANDEKLSLSQGAEHALVSIMQNAKDLYSDKLEETVLARKLSAVIKDLTPETKAEAQAEQLRKAQLKKDRYSYPSPDRSPEPAYPSPISCNDEVDTIASQPEHVNSRKRRNSATESVEDNQSQESGKGKRLRLETSTQSLKGVAIPLCLPSPAPSADESLFTIEPVNTQSQPSASALVNRKRRLSETDDQGVSKRPRHLSIGLRSQSGSDPSPNPDSLLSDETSFDGWFRQIFDRPEADKLGPSGFSVELGNLSDFDYDTLSESRSRQTFKPPTIEVADIPLLDVPWDEYDYGWTDNLSLSSENLKQLKSSVESVGQEPLPKPLAQDLVNLQVSSQVSRPADEFERLFGVSNPSIVDPVVIPLDSASNEIWNFSESINRNDVNSFLKHDAGFEGNSASISSFDLSDSIVFLPTITGTQDKTRQEKEKEFREACEKAQRLALELQKDDLFA